ncbi:MAG: hypothetical protein H7039_05835, partial [Bryobacteraceae bacterium]|nr:hypothetical protein [Bryobacteraceae bacterium]
ASFLWIALALLPYCFLTYMNRVPSRQTYLASLGLSWLVGAAVTRLKSKRVAAIVCLFVLLHNVGILWIWKRSQYLERAEWTDRLRQILLTSGEPVRVHCFPYGMPIASAVADSVGRQFIPDPWPRIAPGCFEVSVGNQLIRIPTR